MSNQNQANINPRHRRLAQLIVGGNSQSQCAKVLGVDKSTVSRWMKEPVLGMEIQRLQEMADVNVTTSVPGMPEKLQEGAHKGIDVLIEILEDERSDSEIMKLKSRAAVEILDRAGYGPIKQVKVEEASVSTHFTREEIEEIKKRARETFKTIDLKVEEDKNK